MFGEPTDERPQTIGFLLIPGFPLMAFAAAVEPLRAANRLSGEPLYRWLFFSADGEPVRASLGINVVADNSIEGDEMPSTVVVCAGLNVHEYRNAKVFAWLRKLARRGADLGCLSTGSQILARAGVLSGYRCTIHWENRESFADEFGDIEVTAGLFEIDRQRFSCSGGTAALDLMLYMIARQHGRELAAAVSEQFLHDHIRDQIDSQRMSLVERLRINHPKLVRTISLMQDNIEDALTKQELARSVDLSTRQLERLFRRYLGRSPASNFSKCYRAQFGMSPRADRARPS
jgi:transcriptional regulator GlxA family with amidase domain